MGFDVLRSRADMLGTNTDVSDDGVGLDVHRCRADILGTNTDVSSSGVPFHQTV